MQARTYSLALIAAAMGFFLATVALNVIADPEAVLGTGLLGPSLNPNDRVLKMRAYGAESASYDGLVFGSSRSGVITSNLLSARLGGAKFAHLGVSAGSIVDYEAMLEFVVRSKVARGEVLRSVFLLLDADLFGSRPLANSTIQTWWPPALTGESSWRFTWRYLVAIQPKAWRSQIVNAWPITRTAMRATDAWRGWSVASAAESTSVAAPPKEGVALEKIIDRRDFSRELALLQRFVALCRTHNIALTVALSPLHRDNAMMYDPDDLADVVTRIAAVVPVWDFGAPEWLSARSDLWIETSHFKAEVANMMLDRIFAGGSPAAPPDFGVLRGN